MVLELLSFAGNTHALQSLIIAAYNRVEIAMPEFEMGKDNKTPAFLAMSPMGKVPVLKTAEGAISEAAAIARYVARMRPDTNMYGASFYEAGLVDQWIEFAKNELDLPVGMWIYPILGFIQSNASNTEKAKEDVKRALAVLNAHLLKKTFLASEAITAADGARTHALFLFLFHSSFSPSLLLTSRLSSPLIAQSSSSARCSTPSSSSSTRPSSRPSRASSAGLRPARSRPSSSTCSARR
jgi:glutathione S-transferase